MNCRWCGAYKGRHKFHCVNSSESLKTVEAISIKEEKLGSHIVLPSQSMPVHMPTMYKGRKLHQAN